MPLSLTYREPHNPGSAETLPVWASPRSLAATEGVSFDFCSTRYLDVSVPWVGRVWLCIHHTLVGIPYAGCPIRRSPDQCSLATPRSFSQLSTSFIASHRLGIHRAPFVA